MQMRILYRASLRLDQELGGRAFSQSLVDRKTLGDLDQMRNSLFSPAIIALFDLPFVPLFLALLFVMHSWLGWLTVAGASIACMTAFETRFLTHRAMDRAKSAEFETNTIEIGSRRAAETVLALGLIRPLAAQWRRERDREICAEVGDA